MNLKNILITGGAGFVGSNLAVRFREAYPSVNVITFDNLLRRGSELNLARLRAAGVRFVHGDVRCPQDFDALPAFDLMVDCSAEPSVQAGLQGSPLPVLQTNLVGTLHCLEAARRAGAEEPTKVYFVTVDFHSVQDPAEKAFFDGIPTNFELPPETVDRLVQAGGQILRAAPSYRTLLKDLETDQPVRADRPPATDHP